MIAYGCLLAEGEWIDLADPPPAFGTSAPAPSYHQEDLVSLEVMKRRHAYRVLALVGDNQTRAAGILDISRSTLSRLINELPESDSCAPVPILGASRWDSGSGLPLAACV